MLDETWVRNAERRISALEMRTAVEEVHRTAVERRLTSIEDTLRWLVRLVIGAVLTGLLAYAMKGGLPFA